MNETSIKGEWEPHMRSLLGVFLIGALAAGACTRGSTAGSMMPTSPTTQSGPVSGAVVTGTWVGTVSDSSGTMMGAGLSAAMMGNMTWQIAQTGNALTGVMQFPGYAGSGTVSATINGKTAVSFPVK